MKIKSVMESWAQFSNIDVPEQTKHKGWYNTYAPMQNMYVNVYVPRIISSPCIKQPGAFKRRVQKYKKEVIEKGKQFYNRVIVKK